MSQSNFSEHHVDTPLVSEQRQLVKYLKSQLIGPLKGENELLEDAPHKRYLMGILFPPAATIDGADETNDENSTTAALSNDFKPSSMALSFAITDDSNVQIDINAGVYERISSREWQRKPLHYQTLYSADKLQIKQISVFDGNARLDITNRPFKHGRVITIALSNQAISTEHLDPSQCLYQANIQVSVLTGHLQEYPNSDRFKLDDEQRELALLYRKRVPWAVGHGTAVSWQTDDNCTPKSLTTDAMPSHEVKDFSTDLDVEKYPHLSNDLLSIAKIANSELATETELLSGYEQLIGCYQDWIQTLKNELLLTHHQLAKDRVLDRLQTAATRMQKAISLLRQSEIAMKAFRLANKAMLMQMVHSGKDFAGTRKQRNSGYQTPNYFAEDIIANFKWRPFQLAFQLLVIESLIPDPLTKKLSNHHDEVDLLWFPTGGGKTEAYLAVAAWEMIYRRLTLGVEGGGTAVIKRYTLRLLTSQQFQRAGSLICALETMRKQLPELGEESFSLGLWAGEGTSPNTLIQAYESYKTLRNESAPENVFQLQICPWCGTEITPIHYHDDQSAYGIRSRDNQFEFYCPSILCDFNQHLPIQVVDEALYKTPPSLLIGTIDKFARLTWKAEASAFFGDNKKAPPSLIIQDELHLISGPLGTIAGIYEAGFDAIIRSLGKPPKVLAATATIRAAQQQSIRLFGRSINIFPPSGTDEADSFFSREEKQKPGRLYVGVMPSGHTGQTALVQTATAALQAPVELGFYGQALDSYWTVPIYHNSRRELGKSMTLARDDIPARLQVISGQARTIDKVEELSAGVKGSRIPDVLANLSKSVPSAVDILPCTNMISVGVDISRLGMMIIAGQPKATSEYIQASSRVGRDKKRPPGIVITQYSPTRPRDRSHYETFKSYHQALYRYVEPTSVTPWAKPALERALHASLIAMVRMTGLWRSNESVQYFDRNHPEFVRQYLILKQRIEVAMVGMSGSEQKSVFEYLEKLVDDWQQRVLIQKPVSRYSDGKQFSVLIKPFEEATSNDLNKADAWPTLNSMRNVDTQTHLYVRGEADE